MSRAEQIYDEAFDVSCHKDDDRFAVQFQYFVQGAEWADKTMIDKACKWLYKNTYKHVDDRRVSMMFEHTTDMIEDFRKAMEE